MAAADLNTIRSVIEGRLATELAKTPPVPVIFNNIPYEPTPNSTWVQCEVTFDDSQYLTIDDGDNLVVGLVVINIFSAPGVGSGPNYTLGKRIRDLYNRINVSDVYFDAPTGPSVITTTLPGGFFQTQVRVTFEFIEEL
jgi:hypothetical protein|tara:strand:+ start:305 stop:721 length:417 start_codon:yes stop_codon:yes gene_type:complete